MSDTSVNKANGRNSNGNETSPLLTNSGDVHDDSGNKTLKFLFNSTHTPGTGSPNIAVRIYSLIPNG
ncbi:hypothetical protein LZ31DRAFT_601441 [Colletotrichum somersetense]|nr:hypothetical protein LZ31DRAFT_601441 [Colletotrichum somersetense]